MGAGLADTWSGGEQYEPYVGRWSRLVARDFLAWLGQPQGLCWLDVGCGTGALAQTVLDLGSPAKLIGVDPSAGYVQHVRQRTGDHRAQFLLGDAHALEFADATFDVVASGLVLNFLSDRHRALGQMKRVARKGGTVAAYVWDYASQMQLMKYFWDTACELDPAAAQLHEGTRFSFCQPDQLAAMFAAADLRDVETTAIVVPTRFADFDDYWNPFLGGQAPAPSYAMSLNEDRRLTLREAIRSRLPVGADSSITLTARAWAIRGRT